MFKEMYWVTIFQKLITKNDSACSIKLNVLISILESTIAMELHACDIPTIRKYADMIMFD